MYGLGRSVKMRILIYSLPLCFAIIAGCLTHKGQPDVASAVPNYRLVPEDVIAALPWKIEQLPVTKSMNGDDFLEALDLEEFGGNISGGVRFNSYFMQLDADHILQIRCDPDSLVITKESIDQILNSAALNPVSKAFPMQEVVVIGCTLRKNWDEVIANRWLEESKTEQDAAGNPLPL